MTRFQLLRVEVKEAAAEEAKGKEARQTLEIDKIRVARIRVARIKVAKTKVAEMATEVKGMLIIHQRAAVANIGAGGEMPIFARNRTHVPGKTSGLPDRKNEMMASLTKCV